ncbi:molybdopterin dinucleotide binding domain-containing protein, partial [Chloroflexota bacterium]
VTMHSMMTPTVKMADIILPTRDVMWEEKNITRSSYGGFESINYCPGVVEPQGEVKSTTWIYVKLAEKLGIDPVKFFKYYTSDENWENDWERYLKDCYQSAVDNYQGKGITIPPWKEFTEGAFLNCDELDDKPFTGWDKQIKEGKPFMTETGKIEFYSNYIADERNRGKGEHYDPFGRLYDDLPADWGDLTPMQTYQPTVKGMDDPRVEEYPLMLLSPHSRYRVHYLFFNHPWLKDHVYRHSVWISATDAKQRGIKENDLIRVYNERGEVVMPAYVTSRIMPGVIALYHGGWYMPDSSGIDFGGTPSTLLGGDFTSTPVATKVTTLVQIEKYKGA